MNEQIVFTVANPANVSLDVIQSAAHAMALVWSHYMGEESIRVHVLFGRRIYHAHTNEAIDAQAAFDVETKAIGFAVEEIQKVFSSDIPLDIAIVVPAAHEMMHIVQLHRGDPIMPSFTKNLKLRENYYDCEYEREAIRVALDVLKSMVPNIEGHIVFGNVEEKIPDKGRFGVAKRYRIELTDARWRDRLFIWAKRMRGHYVPFVIQR